MRKIPTDNTHENHEIVVVLEQSLTHVSSLDRIEGGLGRRPPDQGLPTTSILRMIASEIVFPPLVSPLWTTSIGKDPLQQLV